MRTDACRECGNEMSILETCNDCDTPFVFECKNCNLQTEKQFHRDCIVV